QRYRRGWHHDDRPHSFEDFVSFLYDSPVQTIEFCYRDAGGKLIGVGICDVCPHSLSSVYFYFDPAEARRSFGTFSILYDLEVTRLAAIPFYYLGFWVNGCASMQYKANFHPHELLHPDGVWRREGATLETHRPLSIR